MHFESGILKWRKIDCNICLHESRNKEQKSEFGWKKSHDFGGIWTRAAGSIIRRSTTELKSTPWRSCQRLDNSIMRKRRFTALPVYNRIGISRCAPVTDVWSFFLPLTLKIIVYHWSFLYWWHFTSHNDLLRGSFGVFRCGAKTISLEIENSDVTFYVACELYQHMVQTEFSNTAKNWTNSVS